MMYNIAVAINIAETIIFVLGNSSYAHVNYGICR